MPIKPKIVFCSIAAGFIISSFGTCFADCDYNGNRYADQFVTCQSGHKQKCEYKTWIDLSEDCSEEQSNNHDCTCTDDDTNACVPSGGRCNASQDESGRCIKKCVE